MSGNGDGKQLAIANVGGRPKIIIDWVDFDKLCKMQCTLREIAAWFNCSEDTIERRVEEEKQMGFADYYGQKKEKGRTSLRRLQWLTAESGSVTMQIFLGKNLLNQSDQGIVEPKGKGSKEIPTVVVHIEAPKVEAIVEEDVEVIKDDGE